MNSSFDLHLIGCSQFGAGFVAVSFFMVRGSEVYPEIRKDFDQFRMGFFFSFAQKMDLLYFTLFYF